MNHHRFTTSTEFSIVKINEITDFAVLTVRSFIITQLDCSMNLNFGRRGGEKNTINTNREKKQEWKEESGRMWLVRSKDYLQNEKHWTASEFIIKIQNKMWNKTGVKTPVLLHGPLLLLSLVFTILTTKPVNFRTLRLQKFFVICSEYCRSTFYINFPPQNFRPTLPNRGKFRVFTQI